jgi:hypothetical protein
MFLFGDGVWCMMMPLSTQVLLRHFRELSGLIGIMLPLSFFIGGDGGHCVALWWGEWGKDLRNVGGTSGAESENLVLP